MPCSCFLVGGSLYSSSIISAVIAFETSVCYYCYYCLVFSKIDFNMFWNLVPTLLFISTTQASLLPFVPPYPALCPTKPLVRPAEGLSIPERTYRTARKAKADLALRAWLQRTNPGFGTGSLPTVCLLHIL